MELRMRKAIYIPFAQAVPRVATIDEENCLFFKKGKCKICEKVCQAKAIDHEMKPRVEKLKVRSIIVATGFDVYLPYEIEEYGYKRFANVVTSMEFERIINAAGPTGGHLQRLSEDHGRPKRLAFIQCVGSRDVRYSRAYCCSVCCMYTTKEAILAREHYPDIDSFIFYTDLRAFGKGFNEYIERAKRDYGVKYIRAKPGEIREDGKSKNLLVHYRDPDTHQIKAFEADMVVLATSLIPRKDAKDVAKVLGVELDPNGFFSTPDADLNPMDTSVPGILAAGYCQKPMDIPEAVAEGSAAAARAMETTETVPSDEGGMKA
jgi:heterodisulfide reductase subunit A